MARKGLGKGLDSLIPNIYDEDFDSNSTQSLEDMLNSDEDADVEEIIDDVESSEDVEESNVSETEETESQEEDVSQTDDNKDKEEDTSVSDDVKEEIPEETSEDESDDSDNQEDDSTSELDIKMEHVEEVKKIVEKNPRITLWSSKSSAVFRYLRKTEPEFSISKEASSLIEEAVSKKYPEIWALFDDDE